MKNKIFTLIAVTFTFLICYLIFGLWGILDIKKNDNFVFKNKIDLNFHKKYSDKIHHLRDVNQWGNKEDYLFSKIYFTEKPSKTIILLGDSWIENVSRSKFSKEFVKSFGEKNNFNIYNAGITSFAPSVMHAQYKILKNDFLINPEILVIYIDQTDIGDEYCRYKHNKIYLKNGNFSHVQREKFTRATYDYSKLYLYSDLYFDSTFIKILKFPYIKIEYFFKRNINLIKQISEHGFKNRNKLKCGFQEIVSELINYNVDAEKNFKKSLIELLEHLNRQNNLEKVLLVSFPHINHHKNNYKVNVSNYIDDVLRGKNYEFIKHLNMSNLDFSSINLEEIYKKNDYASHLSDEFHQKIFLNKILSNL